MFRGHGKTLVWVSSNCDPQKCLGKYSALQPNLSSCPYRLIHHRTDKRLLTFQDLGHCSYRGYVLPLEWVLIHLWAGLYALSNAGAHFQHSWEQSKDYYPLTLLQARVGCHLSKTTESAVNNLQECPTQCGLAIHGEYTQQILTCDSHPAILHRKSEPKLPFLSQESSTLKWALIDRNPRQKLQLLPPHSCINDTTAACRSGCHKITAPVMI